jgi:hypothetical protein
MANQALESNPSHDLAGALKGLSDTYLHCRGIQHVWNMVKDMHIVERTTDGHLVERHMSCANCATIRKDRFLLRQDRWQVNRLEVLHPTYAYPEGYIVSEMGHVEHPREILRFEMLTRALGGKAKVNRALTKADQHLE